MRYLIAFMAVGIVLSLAVISKAEDSVCDVYDGAAFGLCNAYCEAMDCDGADPQASDQACDRVLNNFQNQIGEELLPCELPQVCSAEVIAQCDGAETIACNGTFICTRVLRGGECGSIGCATPQ